MSQVKIIKNIIKQDSNDILDINDELDNIRPYDENTTRIATKHIDNQFKYGWARISPFILSKGREKIAKIIDKIGNDNIVRCHTDGIISKIKFNNDEFIGSKLGDLKFEEYSNNIQIINCNNICGFIKKIGKL